MGRGDTAAAALCIAEDRPGRALVLKQQAVLHGKLQSLVYWLVGLWWLLTRPVRQRRLRRRREIALPNGYELAGLACEATGGGLLTVELAHRWGARAISLRYGLDSIRELVLERASGTTASHPWELSWRADLGERTQAIRVPLPVIGVDKPPELTDLAFRLGRALGYEHYRGAAPDEAGTELTCLRFIPSPDRRRSADPYRARRGEPDVHAIPPVDAPADYGQPEPRPTKPKTAAPSARRARGGMRAKIRGLLFAQVVIALAWLAHVPCWALIEDSHPANIAGSMLGFGCAMVGPLLLIKDKLAGLAAAVMLSGILLAFVVGPLSGPAFQQLLAGSSPAGLSVRDAPRHADRSSFTFSDARVAADLQLTRGTEEGEVSTQFTVAPIVPGDWSRAEPVTAWAWCGWRSNHTGDRDSYYACIERWSKPLRGGAKPAESVPHLGSTVDIAAHQHGLLTHPQAPLLVWQADPRGEQWTTVMYGLLAAFIAHLLVAVAWFFAARKS